MHPLSKRMQNQVCMGNSVLVKGAAVCGCFYLDPWWSEESWLPSVSSEGVWGQPARLLCPWRFSRKGTGVGCHFLLQIFLT